MDPKIKENVEPGICFVHTKTLEEGCGSGRGNGSSGRGSVEGVLPLLPQNGTN